MTRVFGRKALLDRIRELHRSGQHVTVVGARSIGKTVLLEAVVSEHAQGSDIFAGAGIVDFRHNPPTSTELALRRVGGALRAVFESSANAELKSLAKELNIEATAEDLYNQMKIALDIIAEGGHRVLLVLDGCDPVLQNSSIPRNLWDNLRALAQAKSLRLMTGSRDQLHRLCYNPEARTSDFFRIFYDEPIVVGPFSEADWVHLYATCGLRLDGAAQKELFNWTGGHPDLVDALLTRLREMSNDGQIGKPIVDSAAESLAARASARIEALWMDCSEESRGDIAQLARGEVSAAEMPSERVRYLVERGIAAESGRKVRLVNRFVERVSGERKTDVAGARRLFARPEDFASNIRTLLEHRLSHVDACAPELRRLIRRALQDIPDDPAGCLGNARDIAEHAIELVWAIEAPDGRLPDEWLAAWRSDRIDRLPAAELPSPDKRGDHCFILRLATGTDRTARRTRALTKPTFALIEHVVALGNARNHKDGFGLTVGFAASFCLTAIELADGLSRELKRPTAAG